MSPLNPRRRNSVRIIAPLAALTLAGCGPLVQIGGNDKPPVALMVLRATATDAPRPVDLRTGRAIIVATPTVPGTLQTLRLPVVTGDNSLAYLVGATWAEQPNRQFAHLLADTLAAAGQPVLDARTGGLSGARALNGALTEFGLDVRAAPVVRVRFDAVLSDSAGKAIAARRFEASEPAATQAPGDVATALNAAANRVAGEVADWVGKS